jgi:hypothetical protein
VRSRIPTAARESTMIRRRSRSCADLNFDFAFTIHGGFSRADDPPFEYPRFLIQADLTTRKFAHRLAYSWLK